jgi:hypothetical protein
LGLLLQALVLLGLLGQQLFSTGFWLIASDYPDIIQMDKKRKHALLSESALHNHPPARTRVLLQAENSAVLHLLYVRFPQSRGCHRMVPRFICAEKRWVLAHVHGPCAE